MFKIKGIRIFYRYFLYGSGLIVGTAISQAWSGIDSWLTMMLYIIGSLLASSSAVITYTVNKYPEEFKGLL
tara:strand:+ start:751 stop:963 length:213 start_codon:yes stop_codon:yes gene_type:complete